MPTASDATKAILSRFQTQMAGTTIKWPNVHFDPVNPQAIWADIKVLWGDGFLSTQGVVGSGTGRNTLAGVIHVNVFGPRGEARGPLNAKADEVRDVFNRVAFSGVECGAASGPKPATAPIGQEWDQTTVTIPFTVDELV